VKTLKEILAPAQFRMVELLGEGCKNKQIASELHTTEQVVKNRFHEIFNLVGCWSRHELAMRFIREQMVQREQPCTSQFKDSRL
jgi:DNA-binding NarL/FixJ family response regulator